MSVTKISHYISKNVAVTKNVTNRGFIFYHDLYYCLSICCNYDFFLFPIFNFLSILQPIHSVSLVTEPPSKPIPNIFIYPPGTEKLNKSPRLAKSHNNSSIFQKQSGVYLNHAQKRRHRKMTWQKGVQVTSLEFTLVLRNGI